MSRFSSIFCQCSAALKEPWQRPLGSRGRQLPSLDGAPAKSGGAAATKAGSAPPPAKRVRDSIASRVSQKIGESCAFKSLDETEIEVVVDAATGLTLRKRLERDLEAAEQGSMEIDFGGLYNRRVADLYRSPDNTWDRLKPAAHDESVICPKLQKAIAASLGTKPDRAPLLAWLAQSTSPSYRDVVAVWRWCSCLRASCIEVQLPAIMRVIDWTVRPL